MSLTPKSAQGECFCGKVQFEVSFPSKFCCHCHCTTCRRAHGAAFVTWIGFKKEQFKWIQGEPQVMRYTSPSGATRSFCKICGTTMLFEAPRWKGEIHVALATLKDPVDRKPSSHVFFDDRADWISVHDELSQYGGKSGTELLSK